MKRARKSGTAEDVRPIHGPQTQGRNRDKTAVTTIVEIAKWPAKSSITELTIQCFFSSGVTITTADQLAALSKVYGKVVIDAASTPIATELMSALNSATDDNGYFPIPVSLPGNPSVVRIPLTSELTQGSLGGGVVHAASSDGSTALDFWIGAN